MTELGPNDDAFISPSYLAEGTAHDALNPDELFEEELIAEAEEPTEPVASEAEVDAALEEVAAGAEDETRHDFPFRRAAAKVSRFPRTPGVYLMKDAAGRVIYVGKAKNLRSRAGSYFTKQAREEYRTRSWVHEIADADCVECESEVDALLMESRLIKDIQPPHNKELKDDKTFPYLMITLREDYPRVMVTRQPVKNMRLFGPFASAGALRGAVQVLQRIFQFRTCSLDIEAGDERWRWFRPCLLASIKQCTAPCNLRISKEDYKRAIDRLGMFLEGKKETLLAQMRDEMQAASKGLQFE
jgi:excinuclease ABC subunit C